MIPRQSFPYTSKAVISALFLLLMIAFWSPENNQIAPTNKVLGSQSVTNNRQGPFAVVNVINGDTIEIQKNNQIKRIHLLGVIAPTDGNGDYGSEECFGIESTQNLKQQLLNKQIYIESDASIEDDSLIELKKYVFLNDQNINLQRVQMGYALADSHENYTLRSTFEDASAQAKTSQNGLWSPQTCDGILTKSEQIPATQSECRIKGNVSLDGKKIYYLPECPEYQQTEIQPQFGEQWFCSESEASSSGWKKATTCL